MYIYVWECPINLVTKLVAKPKISTVVENIEVVRRCRSLGGRVWPGFFHFWAALGLGWLFGWVNLHRRLEGNRA